MKQLCNAKTLLQKVHDLNNNKQWNPIWQPKSKIAKRLDSYTELFYVFFLLQICIEVHAFQYYEEEFLIMLPIKISALIQHKTSHLVHICIDRRKDSIQLKFVSLIVNVDCTVFVQIIISLVLYSIIYMNTNCLFNNLFSTVSTSQ